MKTLLNKLLLIFGLSLVRKQTVFNYEKLLKEQKKEQAIDYKGISLNQLFQLFKLTGFNPNHIIDVGAHKGGWTREIIKYFPNSNYTLLEPQEELKEYAIDLTTRNNVSWLSVGAGSHDEKCLFTYVDRPDSRSFIYSENEAKEKGLIQKQIQIHRLDTIIESGGFGIPEIVKIDAEGLDLDVLKGLGNFLGKVEVIFVEVAISCDVYENSLEDVVSMMHKYGYRVFDVTDINRPLEKPVLWLMELAFVKINGIIDNYNW